MWHRRPLDSWNAPAAATGDPQVAETALLPPVIGARYIVIGGASYFIHADDADQNRRFDEYRKHWKKYAQPPAFTSEWYAVTAVGHAQVLVNALTGVRIVADVPKDLADQISFRNPIIAWSMGMTTDLLAAEWSPALGSWVTRRLCSAKDLAFATCASQYDKGIYQAVDGREISVFLKLKSGGKRIDVNTYKTIDAKHGG
jgi:hypothetical protein